MAFVASQQQAIYVPAGGGTMAVTIPRASDIGGNGTSWPMFSHVMLVSAGTTGGSGKLGTAGGNAAWAIKPDQTTILIQQDATNITAVFFGKVV